jgi:ubiquinone/menaquinone biosynthesis C-methylase UbiE
MPQVLHVGCGSATIARMPAGFQDGSWQEVRFDINPDVFPDIVGTITDMHNVPSDSVDAIYSSHNIEHVYPHEVTGVLAEFRRVLKPDGFLVVTCPDLQSFAQQIADGGLEDPLYTSPSGPITPLDILYGHRPSLERGEIYMAHRTGFTGKTIMRYASDAGFAAIGARRRPKRFDLWMIATKQPRDRTEIDALLGRFTHP